MADINNKVTMTKQSYNHNNPRLSELQRRILSKLLEVETMKVKRTMDTREKAKIQRWQEYGIHPPELIREMFGKSYKETEGNSWHGYSYPFASFLSSGYRSLINLRNKKLIEGWIKLSDEGRAMARKLKA